MHGKKLERFFTKKDSVKNLTFLKTAILFILLLSNNIIIATPEKDTLWEHIVEIDGLFDNPVENSGKIKAKIINTMFYINNKFKRINLGNAEKGEYNRILSTWKITVQQTINK